MYDRRSTTQEANLVFLDDTSDDMVKSTVSGTRFGSLSSISQNDETYYQGNITTFLRFESALSGSVMSLRDLL
jgi:hypothetical protein